MAPHSSTLAWKIAWTEEPGGLQSMGSLRVGHDWATSLSVSLSCIGEGNGTLPQCSCQETPREGGAWWAAIYGVAQSRTQLKWLSSSSSSLCYMVNIILYFTPWVSGTQKVAVGYILDSVTILASVLLYIGWRSWTCSGFLCHSKLCNQGQVI